MGEQHNAGVDVACLANGRVDTNSSACVDLDDVAAGDVPRHVEVVNCHVVEHSARDADVLDGRWSWVAAGDAAQVHVANGSVLHCIGDGFVARVEPPVETDLELDASIGDGVETTVDLCQVKRDWLLAEDRSAGDCRSDHGIDMGVGAGADRYCVNVFCVDGIIE